MRRGGAGVAPADGPRVAMMIRCRPDRHAPDMSLPRTILVAAAIAALAACTTAPKPPAAPAAPPGGSTKFYKGDGPGENAPANIDAIPDAEPRREALNRFANRPYSVFGREYVPATSLRPYRERGVASWYGRMFHGQKTAIGETYDMYAMTAAHPTLPLPSYARVTSTATGKSVVVRVNDRGPFLHDRIIDLSFAAAAKLGIAQKGSGEVDVEAIIPGETVQVAAAPLPTVASAPAAPQAVGTPASEMRASVPVTSADGGFAVQLGAFASNANAQEFVARVANQLAPVGVEAKVRQSGGLFRVFVGPYPTRDEAKRTADRLREALGLPSVIAVQ